MSVSNSFATLLTRLTPLESEARAIEGHFATIETRVRQTFDVSKCMKVGSYSRGTMIRGRSDGDLFVVLRRNEIRHGDNYVSSDTILNRVRADLKLRYPASTVYKDVNSVTVAFANARIDVVPGFFWETMADGWPLYYMPDGNGGWLKTSPEKHTAYLKEADRKAGGQMKNVARLMKFWRECRTPRVPISSFHLEMRLAGEGIGVGAVSYADAVRKVLRKLVEKECRGIQDPLGISGVIPCVKTDAQWASTLVSVRSSRDKANTAETYEGWNTAEAKRYWGMVFNGKFPA